MSSDSEARPRNRSQFKLIKCDRLYRYTEKFWIKPREEFYPILSDFELSKRILSYNFFMYDDTCRFLAENFSADFASWLLGEPVTLTQIQPSELSLDPI